MTNNILMISVDDMMDVVQYRDAFGTSILTPNIDRLMAMGVTFENAFAPSPVCAPSRAAAVTAQSAFSTGVHFNNNAIQDFVAIEDTIFGSADAAGYYLWSQGKFLHHHNDDDTQAYLAQAFDFLGSGGSNIGGWGDGSKKTMTGGSVEPGAKSEDEFNDTVTATAASDFLISYDGDNPFFMAVGINKPHLGWSVPQAYYDLYDVADIVPVEIDGVSFEDLPEFYKNALSVVTPNLQDSIEDRGDWSSLIQAYLAALTYADTQIGKVLDALDESGHWADTTVAFFSDHGYHLGDRDVWHKFTLWEEAAAIPMIIVDPSLEAGTINSTPASLLDLWPTISGLADIEAPVLMDGVDLFSVHGREAVMTTAFGSISIRTEEWRYTLYNDGEEELFSADDIGHATAIVDADPGLLAEMRALLVSEAASQYGVIISDADMRGTDADEHFIVVGEVEVRGGHGDDTFFVTDDGAARGGAGHDTVLFTGGYLKMHKTVEDAVVYSRAEGTEIVANGKANELTGNIGANTLRGRNGADSIDGGGGDDRIYGGRGKDTLTGGEDSDRFVFKTGHGRDTITDFDPASDVIKIEDFVSAEQDGVNVVIKHGDGDMITVLNTDVEDIL